MTRVRTARRPSPQTLLVLAVMAEDPRRTCYGRQLRLETGLGPGTVYPILRMLESRGWVASTWEDVDPAVCGRPRRRLYRLTDEGIAEASPTA